MVDPYLAPCSSVDRPASEREHGGEVELDGATMFIEQRPERQPHLVP